MEGSKVWRQGNLIDCFFDYSWRDFSNMSRKRFLRLVRPDVFDLLKDKTKNFDIGTAHKEDVEFICPRCGCIVKQKVSNVIQHGLSCKRCGDGISFGEKFIFNVLEQLNINFDVHVLYEWSDNKIYDIAVYKNGICNDTIIEIHGKQHYVGGFESYGGRTKEDEQLNDECKKQLAFQNGYCDDTYVIVNCMESTFTYIKESILHNSFFLKFDLSSINWEECFNNAVSSYAIKALRMWEDGFSVSDISNKLKINRSTVLDYLKKFVNAGMCSYNEHESRIRGHLQSFVPSKPKIVACPELKLIFYSQKKACQYCGLHDGAVSAVLCGRCKYNISKKYNIRLTWFEIESPDDIENLSKNNGYTVVGEPLTYKYNEHVA